MSATPKIPPPPKKPAKPTRPPTKPPKRSADDQNFAAVDALRADLAVSDRSVLAGIALSLSLDLEALGADPDPVLAFRLRMARARVDELLGVKSPARQALPLLAGVSSRSATPDGPVLPPADTGKGPAPGPAAALGRAVCGSDDAVVALVAGAGSGRVESVDPLARPGTFSLPLRLAVPRFDAELLGAGPLYHALPSTQVGVAEYGGAR